MDSGLKDLIDELREYAAPRKGELAGMLLEAANRLEEQDSELSIYRRIDLETDPETIEGLYNADEISIKLRNVVHGHFNRARTHGNPYRVELAGISKYGERNILRWRGMGPALLEELRTVMHKHGYRFSSEEADNASNDNTDR